MADVSILKDAEGFVFDLDGTLIDSAPDLHMIAADILHNLGLTPYSLTEIRGFIGHGLGNLVQQCLDGRNFTEVAHERQAVLDRFVRKYRLRPAVHSEIYPGTEDFLSALRAKGVKIGICTNKQHDIAATVIDELGLSRFVDSLVGGGRTQALKPDPAPIALCLSEMGVAQSAAVYIGDSETDEAAAHAAGLPFLLYEHGYRKKAVPDFSAAMSFGDFAALTESL